MPCLCMLVPACALCTVKAQVKDNVSSVCTRWHRATITHCTLTHTGCTPQAQLCPSQAHSHPAPYHFTAQQRTMQAHHMSLCLENPSSALLCLHCAQQLCLTAARCAATPCREAQCKHTTRACALKILAVPCCAHTVPYPCASEVHGVAHPSHSCACVQHMPCTQLRLHAHGGAMRCCTGAQRWLRARSQRCRGHSLCAGSKQRHKPHDLAVPQRAAPHVAVALHALAAGCIVASTLELVCTAPRPSLCTLARSSRRRVCRRCGGGCGRLLALTAALRSGLLLLHRRLALLAWLLCRLGLL